MTDYEWWGAVPDHLVTKTTLAALDMPRCADGVPVAARVTDRRLRGNPVYDLFDVTRCPPTSATARQLAAARATSTRARSYRCGARTERPVPAEGTGAGLCPACGHIAQLRAEQTRLAMEHELVAADAAAVLDGPTAVVVQVDPHVLPRPGYESPDSTGAAWSTSGNVGYTAANCRVRLALGRLRGMCWLVTWGSVVD